MALQAYAGWRAVDLMAIAMHWTRASAETQDLAGTGLVILNIVALGLVLVEGFRWFKKKARLSTDV
jgi:hypothetical protein